MSATATLAPAITHRFDFVLLFDVINGNPNGDPDAGNSPRIDNETGCGLVTDVCLKRKIRDYVTLARGAADGQPAAGYDIYVKHRGVLQTMHRQAYEVNGLKLDEKDKALKLGNVEKARRWMCQTFFDIRAFGAVLTLDINCGQVRGPVQLTFARSLHPIATPEQSIVRKAVATEREADEQIGKHGQVTGTMGRKTIVPYGLYEAHGFISASLAAQTGFNEDDLALLWEALINLFEHDRSATRGEMATRKLVVFEHSSALGNAPAHRLFERVQTALRPVVLAEHRPARAFSDYQVTVNTTDLPAGVTVHELV